MTRKSTAHQDNSQVTIARLCSCDTSNYSPILKMGKNDPYPGEIYYNSSDRKQQENSRKKRSKRGRKVQKKKERVKRSHGRNFVPSGLNDQYLESDIPVVFPKDTR